MPLTCVLPAESQRTILVQLKALFDRPVGFRRDAVGGMGTGMCCLAARVKALGHGADCGARTLWRMLFVSCCMCPTAIIAAKHPPLRET